jgi:hypothetical protein
MWAEVYARVCREHAALVAVYLRVEELGGSGQAASRVRDDVVEALSPQGGEDFEVPVPDAGASYRVSVTTFDFVGI